MAQAWWVQTLTSGPAVTYLLIAGACLLLLVTLGWRLRRVTALARERARRDGRSGESGVATIEFALVTPFLLTITLVLIQTMLVFTGLFYVNYAAFAATRSAIVYIPADLGGEEANTITPFVGGAKFDRIRSAAVIAVMPVSGQEDGDLQASDELVDGLNRYFESQGEDPPRWVRNLAAGRLNYAAAHTIVTLQTLRTLEDGTVLFDDATGVTTYGPKDAVAVEVRHEFALTVPLASQLFSLGGSDDSGARSGTYNPENDLGAGAAAPPGSWTVITARAVLTNEGVTRTLPDPPRVPRR